MANGDEINSRLEFKERIGKLPPEERIVEVALMVYDLNEKVCSGNGFSKRGTVISATTITTIMIAVVEGLKAIFSRG